jgi:hypothetical protein
MTQRERAVCHQLTKANEVQVQLEATIEQLIDASREAEQHDSRRSARSEENDSARYSTIRSPTYSCVSCLQMSHPGADVHPQVTELEVDALDKAFPDGHLEKVQQGLELVLPDKSKSRREKVIESVGIGCGDRMCVVNDRL